MSSVDFFNKQDAMSLLILYKGLIKRPKARPEYGSHVSVDAFLMCDM
jgi:hypothetical protein